MQKLTIENYITFLKFRVTVWFTNKFSEISTLSTVFTFDKINIVFEISASFTEKVLRSVQITAGSSLLPFIINLKLCEILSCRLKTLRKYE